MLRILMRQANIKGNQTTRRFTKDLNNKEEKARIFGNL